jgi:hypothetical protein
VEPNAKFETFDEFWPFYVREHAKKSTRILHFAGTTAGMGLVAAALVLRRPRLLKWSPVVGYAAAWIGHFFFEGNKPATFKYPLWSLRADFVMWGKMIAGTMDDEVAKHTSAGRAATNGEAASGADASTARDAMN